MKKGALKKGPSPTLINVYGGFDITPRPSFDPAIFTFLNNGGIYALANIRGGSNSVKDWHTSGAVLKKQNSIDDTYYAARFLIDSGFAQADKVAITGSSNGGLVVAATINQHPETFRVALLNAGVYDMIRLENYTAGVYYENEYGSIDDSLQFKNLLSYSPLHNVKENTTYPSMWITTSDFDDRVPPFHTYKYVAALQKLTHSKNPILLKVILNEGHSPSSSSFTKALTKTLFYSFLFNELGMKYKPSSFYDNKGTD
jgi:prolyl oligopeptidase